MAIGLERQIRGRHVVLESIQTEYNVLGIHITSRDMIVFPKLGRQRGTWSTRNQWY